MSNDRLERKLELFFDGEKATVIQTTFERDATTLEQILDAMNSVGTILEEDLDQGIYVARVTGGRRRNYGPIIAATPSADGVDAGGIVVRGKVKPVDKAMKAFGDALDGKPPKRKRRHLGLRLFFLLLLILGALGAFSYYYYFLPNLVVPAQAATVRYNEAVDEYNAVVPRYNSAVNGLSVENLRGFVQEAQELSVQGTGYLSVSKAVVGGNRAEKIEADTATVRAMAKELAAEIPILDAIRNPSEEWVAEKLEGVDGVDQIRAVTATNDPNGMLGKDGGYSSCTYFTTGLLGKDVVKGYSPVQKGVDGGGAIEVYPTLEDAQARCEYLAGFDDTILYSGSYALVGTMVIRTSCLLDDDAQYTLTNNIVDSMTEA